MTSITWKVVEHISTSRTHFCRPSKSLFRPIQHFKMVASMPDAEIHPRATGPAISIVEAHQKEEPLILYSGWFCPFVQRTWVTLEEKKIPYQYIEVNPYKKEASFLALNPRGLVPTLAVPITAHPSSNDERKPLIESSIICDYLDETYSSKDTISLYPRDNTYNKFRLRIWIDFVGSRIIPAFHRFLQHTSDSAYSLQDARTEFHNHLRTWIKEADPAGPFFAGQEFTMADVALAPWAVRLWVFDHFKEGGLGLPAEGGEGDDEVWARWRKWATAVQERPSIKNTLSEKEHYLPLWQRYADNTAQSEMAKATRQGKGVP